MTITQIGIDIGKNSFHVIGLGLDGAIVLRKWLSRSQLLRFFQDRAEEALAIAFEAGSGAHWLPAIGRTLHVVGVCLNRIGTQ